MQNANIQELLEVGIGGKAAPDDSKQYLKRLERELQLEEEMHTDGVIRYKKETDRAKNKNSEELTHLRCIPSLKSLA